MLLYQLPFALALIISLVKSEVLFMEKFVTLACIVGCCYAWYKLAALWWSCHVEFEELKEGDTNECDN